MAVTAEENLQQLLALLPKGPAWPRESGTVLYEQLANFADELARINLRIIDLVNEADPRTTYELLSDWERVAGLPDPCVTDDDQTIEQRQIALTAKLTLRGDQSRPYFINLAAGMGYPDATIDEFLPMTCNDTCNDALWSEDDKFTWQINLPSDGGIVYANCNSDCTVPLQSWGDQAIECRINRYKPAHTVVIFAYPELEI